MSLKYLVINGNPYRDKKELDHYIDSLFAGIKSAGHEVQSLVLRDMKIKPCTGCFSCWVKNPGNCIIQDDGNEVARQYIASDHVILASPLIMGFLSSLLKNAMDRNIPLVHPHLEEVDSEVHHKKRYDKYPVISFLLAKESFTDAEDIAIVTGIFQREAINVRSSLGFVRFIETPVEEVLHALNIY
jgi:multimeric flavodoxin WrbA